MATLKTRRPTGQVAYPMILVEGTEKVGKTFAALALSNSERVGRTFVLELDEPTADEYAPLGDFEILEHNGTFTSIKEQLQAATEVEMEDDKPNVIVIDTGTALWNLLKDWTAHRARNSKKGKAALASDPDAEIDVAMNLWNDAKDRWNSILNLLRKWPGIAVIVARGREVAKVVNGQPVANQTEWSTEIEKSTPFAVSATVRMGRPHKATLTTARSLHVDVPARGIELPESNPLEHLVFNVLGAGGGFQVSSAVAGQVGKPRADAKRELIEIIRRAVKEEDKATKEAGEVWQQAKLGDVQELSDEQWQKLAALAAEHIVALTKDAEDAPAAEQGKST